MLKTMKKVRSLQVPQATPPCQATGLHHLTLFPSVKLIRLVAQSGANHAVDVGDEDGFPPSPLLLCYVLAGSDIREVHAYHDAGPGVPAAQQCYKVDVAFAELAARHFGGNFQPTLATYGCFWFLSPSPSESKYSFSTSLVMLSSNERPSLLRMRRFLLYSEWMPLYPIQSITTDDGRSQQYRHK